MKYILRILALPFLLALHIIYAVGEISKTMYLFMRYGGEWIGYEKYDKVRIHELYQLMK